MLPVVLTYLPFSYGDNRYSRIAASPWDNRKEDARRRYDQAPPVPGEKGAYGRLRPRILVETKGDGQPVKLEAKQFPVCAMYWA